MKLTEKSESSDLAAVNGPLDLVSSCSRFLLLSFCLIEYEKEASNEWFEEKDLFFYHFVRFWFSFVRFNQSFVMLYCLHLVMCGLIN